MFYLKRNLLGAERSLRLAAALLLGLACFRWPPSHGAVWTAGVLAATFAATALLGCCPACALLGRKSVARVP